MHWLCRLGLHNWQREYLSLGFTLLVTRHCRRHGCTARRIEDWKE